MNPVIYLSTFFPPSIYSDMQMIMTSVANVSASTFSYSLLMGLASNLKEKFYVINTPLTGPYPINYKKPLSKSLETIEFNVPVRSIGMNNIYGIQGLSIRKNLLSAMKATNVGNADILIYSIQLPILQAAVHYKNIYKGSKIILVVPDLYEDLGGNSKVKKTIKEFLFGNFNKLCKTVDGYVLLTEKMLEHLPFKRPYCVVEGIYNPTEKRPAAMNGGVFTILYTGMLYEKFGVKNLIDAILSLEEKDVKLQLCGSGELVEYIKTINDSRIEYLGIVPREKVLQLQSEASLLVNPRQPNGGFTRYSFPSKNIEYLASGTPTLIYELEGIPQEYYQYCYHLSAEEKSVKAFARKITEIYHTSKEEREKLANDAQQFIFSQKNAPAQCEKIIRMIDSL